MEGGVTDDETIAPRRLWKERTSAAEGTELTTVSELIRSETLLCRTERECARVSEIDKLRETLRKERKSEDPRTTSEVEGSSCGRELY